MSEFHKTESTLKNKLLIKWHRATEKNDRKLGVFDSSMIGDPPEACNKWSI